MSNVTSFHVTGDWRHIIDDGMVDVDALPDEARPTGHVIFTPLSPKIAVAGAPAVAHTLGKVSALIAGGELTDLQGREGVWLAGKIGDQTVRWRAVTHLIYKGQKIAYPVLEFDLVDDAVLTGLIQNSEPGQPPIVVDPRIEALVREAQAALNQTRTMLAEATEFHEAVEQWHGEIMPAAAQVAEDRQIAHDASALAVLAAANAGRIIGEGSPEGAHDAPIGTIFVDTANGELWHKTTAEGSTSGWKKVGTGASSDAKWFRGEITDPAAIATMFNETHQGNWSVSASNASAAGLPEPGAGNLTVDWASGTDSYASCTHYWQSTRSDVMWQRRKYSGEAGFGSWTQFNGINDAVASGLVRRRGALTASSVLSSLANEAGQGEYRVSPSSVAAALNLPTGTEGRLSVTWLAGVGSPTVMFVWQPRSGGTWFNTFRGGSFDGWTQDFPQSIKDYVDSKSSAPRVVPTGKVADDLKFETDQGKYRITSSAQATSLGLPESSSGVLSVDWVVGIGTPVTIQTFATQTGNVWRHIASGSAGWQAWTKDGGSSAPARELGTSAVAAIEQRDLLIRGRGRIGTSGKPVVALRYDHNNKAFNEVVMPMLQERGLPASQCQFVNAFSPDGIYTADESTGYTWAEVNTNFCKGVEVHSHSWTHREAATEADLRKEIVQSKAQIETQAPDVKVAGWMMPGIAGTGVYMGWGDVNGMTPEQGDTLAGRLLMATYGCHDSMGSAYTPLGTRRFGHRSFDTEPNASAAISHINQGVASGMGTVIMIHPSRLQEGGSSTSPATYAAILDHIVSLRDSGQIEVLTVGGMTLADPGSSYRHSLGPALTGYSGWGSGSSRTGTPSSGELAATISLTRLDLLKGWNREVAATVSGTGTLTVTVTDPGNSRTLNTRTVSVNGSQIVRLPFGVPRSAGSLKVALTVTSGEVTVTDIKAHSI